MDANLEKLQKRYNNVTPSYTNDNGEIHARNNQKGKL